MKKNGKSHITSILRWGCWGILALNAMFIFFMAEKPVTEDNLMESLAAIAVMFVSLAFASATLIVLYQKHLSNWMMWLFLFGLFIASGLPFFGMIAIPHSGVSGILTLGHVFSGWAIFIAMIITLIRYDIGLAMVGWITIIFVWFAAGVWIIQGDFFSASFDYVLTGEPAIVWWFNEFSILSCCLIPFALLSFAYHTTILIKREVKQEIPPHQ